MLRKYPLWAHICYVQVLLYVTKLSRERQRELISKVKPSGLLFPSSFTTLIYCKLCEVKPKINKSSYNSSNWFWTIPIFKLWFHKMTSNTQSINTAQWQCNTIQMSSVNNDISFYLWDTCSRVALILCFYASGKWAW